MLIVNENSYVTLDEANEYIKTHLPSNDEYRIKWNNTPDEDKEVWLIRSTQALDNLKYIGRRKGMQILEFPRVISLGVCGYVATLYTSQYYDNGLIQGQGPSNDMDGMKAIKKACIENAVAGCNLNDIVQSTRIANLQGLTSMRAGSVAKTYNRNNRATTNSENDIYTEKVYSILIDWLQSGRYTV